MHASGAGRSGATWPGRTKDSHAAGVKARPLPGLIMGMADLHPVEEVWVQAPRTAVVRTHQARTRHARQGRAVPINPGTARPVKAFVTCVPAQSRTIAKAPGTRRGALLMRLGGNTLRGSNPRSSAI